MADEEQVDKSTHSDNQYSLDTAKHKEIDDLLQGYSDAVTTKLKCAIGLSHKMNTQAHDPIRTPPYRLAPGWRDQLGIEVQSFLELGTFEPLLSPWSFPMVVFRIPELQYQMLVLLLYFWSQSMENFIY